MPSILTPALRRQVHAVVLAGGSGQRFWPRSRRHHPKPLLRVLGGKSLLEATVKRASGFAAKDQVWLVCGEEHAAPMRKEARGAGVAARRVVVEPRGRDTAMAAGVAAVRIAAEDPEAILAVLPADHVIPDRKAFSTAMDRAVRAAAEEDVLVTLGVRPTRPETGYGYIRVGAAVAGHAGLHRVSRFVEKPGLAQARRYLRGGKHLWNAGIFVWRARTLLEEIEAHAPEIHRALAPVRACPRGRGAARALELAYRRAPALPIDVAVLERSRRVWTHPLDFHWSDVGTWGSLALELGVDDDHSRVIDGDVILEEAPGNLVWADGRLVVLVGVEGLAVIDTPDALLVTSLERSSELKRVVAQVDRKHGSRV